ncbi:MAG: DUF4177 domain-containing protein [Alphaproteobacteria bacterium]
MSHEYRVIPAPTKGTKAKGTKTAEDRFALSLQQVMNSMAAEGWEFQRAETLPAEERSGLTGRKTVYHNMLVFRRRTEAALEAFQPRELRPVAAEPMAAEPVAAAPVTPAPEPVVDAPARFIRPTLTAVSEPSAKAPPVPSPLSLSGSLVKDGSDSARD